MDLSERPDQEAQGLYVQLNKAMASHDMKAVSRAMKDFAGIGDHIDVGEAQHDCQWQEAHPFDSKISKDTESP